MPQTPVPTQRLAYGTAPQQWAEFTGVAQTDDGPPPLVVNIHGGFWHADHDLAHARPFCGGLRERGIATLNLEYRRVGNRGGGWPGTFDDVRDALGLVGRLAGDGLVDPSRVVLAGHSAGGHLALWLAGVTTMPLAGVVTIGGITDLVAAHRAALSDRGTATQDLMGTTPDDDAPRWRDASPIMQVPLDVEVVVVHGARDRMVPASQGRDYVAAAQAAGGRASLQVVADDGHFAVLDPHSTTFAVTATAIARLAGAQS